MHSRALRAATITAAFRPPSGLHQSQHRLFVERLADVAGVSQRERTGDSNTVQDGNHQRWLPSNPYPGGPSCSAPPTQPSDAIGPAPHCHPGPSCLVASPPNYQTRLPPCPTQQPDPSCRGCEPSQLSEAIAALPYPAARPALSQVRALPTLRGDCPPAPDCHPGPSCLVASPLSYQTRLPPSPTQQPIL